MATRSSSRPPAWATNGLLAVVLMVVVAVMATLSDTFLTVDNLLNATRFTTEIGLVALGMTLVMITGGIDLSVGAIIALTAVVIGMLIQAGLGAWPGAFLGLGLGVLLGALNGLVITRVGLPPIITTLATLAIYRGVAYGISGARAFPIPESLSVLGQGYLGLLPVQLPLFLLVAAGVWVLLARTTFGRTLYALGVNETAARFAGLHVDRVKLAAYALSGLLSAAAAVIFIARVSSAKANAGEGYELDAITIVVLGGGSVAGGRGGVIGTLLGLAIIGVTRNGLTQAYVPPEVQAILIGGVLVIAVVGNELFARWWATRRASASRPAAGAPTPTVAGKA
jgi:rhamnose transport system permease protein